MPHHPRTHWAEPQPIAQRGCIIPEMQNHQHPGQQSKSDRDKPSGSSPRANTIATATPHIHPYICRDMLKTTNPKHTPPPRNHPANKPTPPQYNAEKPNATTKHTEASPTDPNPPGLPRNPAPGQHAPGILSTQAHPRPTQEQHGHQASNQCPLAQAPLKHCMQPPDFTPESHQSPTQVGTPARTPQ
ncbi:hypothetical protein CRENBAI_009956, partial [Crenichthys baileyi]